MTPQCIPTPKPQPDETVYSLDALNLLPKFTTAAAYKAFYGVAPPPFNATLPLKFWEDDSQASLPDDATGEYDVLATVTNTTTGVSALVLPPTYTKLVVPAAQACKVNIWQGLTTYPVYTPASTDAVETITLSDGSLEVLNGINPEYLSTSDQANRLYSTLQGTGGVFVDAPSPGPGNIHIDYKDETRRMYAFVDSDGQKQIVGILVSNENAKGVGYPGSWANVANPDYVPNNTVDTSQNVWVWVPGTPPNNALPVNVTVMAMPVRHLLPNESFTEPAVGTPMIQRTF